MLCTDEMVIKGQKYCYYDRNRVRNTVTVKEIELEILLCTDEMVIKGQKYCYSDRDRVRNTVIVIEKEL